MFAIIYYYWSTCSCWPTDDREMSLSSWGPAALGGSGWNAASSSTLGRPQSTLLYTPSSLKGEKGHSRERGSRNRMNSVGGPSGVIHMSPGATKHSEFQLHCSPWSPPSPLLQTNGCALVRKVSMCVWSRGLDLQLHFSQRYRNTLKSLTFTVNVTVSSSYIVS